MNTNNTFSDLKISSPLDINIYIKNVDLSIINSLRRVIISEIKNVGFHFDPNDFSTDKDIVILQNDSPLHNEFILKRISLIPIHVNVDELDNWNMDDYVFEINKTNTTGALLSIYSSDFIVLKNNVVMPDLAKRFFPSDPITKDHIIITKLHAKDSSKFVMKAKAIKANPETSTSFGMVSKCAVEFIVDENMANKKKQLYIKENQNKMSESDMIHQFDTIERERYYYRNQYREPNFYKFSITSECSIPSVIIMSRAIQVLKAKMIRFKTTEHDIINQNNLFTIIVRNESHTLGNLFQSLCFNNFIRDKSSDDDDKYQLRFIGYNKPHPLDNMIIIKIKGDKIQTPNDVKAFINEGSEYILTLLVELENQWNTISNQ
jgi:DNA-directed RNA polymerase subunit L